MADCASAPCANGGSCTQSAFGAAFAASLGFVCQCTAGFRGDTCADATPAWSHDLANPLAILLALAAVATALGFGFWCACMPAAPAPRRCAGCGGCGGCFFLGSGCRRCCCLLGPGGHAGGLDCDDQDEHGRVYYYQTGAAHVPAYPSPPPPPPRLHNEATEKSTAFSSPSRSHPSQACAPGARINAGRHRAPDEDAAGHANRVRPQSGTLLSSGLVPGTHETARSHPDIAVLLSNPAFHRLDTSTLVSTGEASLVFVDLGSEFAGHSNATSRAENSRPSSPPGTAL